MDKELDDLLDSALSDFDKKPTIMPQAASAQATGSVTIEKTNLYVDDIDYDDRPARKTMPDLKQKPVPQASSFNEEMKLFDEIFTDAKNKESMKQLQSALEMLPGNDPKMLENFEKLMADLIKTNLGDDDDDDDDFEKIPGFDLFKNLTKETTSNKEVNSNKSDQADAKSDDNPNVLKKVLDDMNKNSEKVLKNDSLPGAFLSSFLNSLNENSEEAVSGDENLDSASSLMMQPVLSMLFSKEILYPSLKLMSENYEKYINEKKEKMSEDELKKCLDQKDCIEKMCKVYEESNESDSQEAKTKQLKQILDLLEKCGMPPSELVPEVNPFEGFGDQIKGNNPCPVS